MTAKKSASTPATPTQRKPRARKSTPTAAPPPSAAPSGSSEASKPFYAYIGASELAVSRVRALTESARTRELPVAVRMLPVQLRALQEKLQSTIQEKATSRYAELAARGEEVVTGIRSQGATEQAEKAARATLAQAKGVGTTAQRAAKQTLAQAKGVRTSARKTVGAVAEAAMHAADKMS
jgi:hypothetical protein